MISRAQKLLRWSLFGVVFLLACNGGSSSPLPAPAPEPEPPAPPPPYSLSLFGGAGTAAAPDEYGYGGDGGNGGMFQASNLAGGDVQVLATGTVDTTVTLPTAMPYLGVNWQDITADTTIDFAETGLRWSDGEIYNDEGEVTGLWVRPGVTLTLKPNSSSVGGPYDSAYLTYLADGIIVEGTIKLAPQDSVAAGDGLGTSTSNFYLGYNDSYGGYNGSLYIGPSGKIDLSGPAGGNGGSFTAYVDVLNNMGTITTAGGAGSEDGGNGGGVTLWSMQGYAVTTGSIVTDGGAGGTGAGGSAGSLEVGSGEAYFEGWWGEPLQSPPGFVVANGLLSATGADGAQGGGSAGGIYLFANGGAVVASGEFRDFGGSATVSGYGGSGGWFGIDAYGTIRLAGSVDTHGGAGMTIGWGGSAGNIVLTTYPLTAPGIMGNISVPDYQGIYVGADLIANGGEGPDGGDGAVVSAMAIGPMPEESGSSGPTGPYLRAAPMTAAARAEATILPNPVVFLRYESIDTSGGNGLEGGDAASAYPIVRDPSSFPFFMGNALITYPGQDASDFYHLGSVVNEADFAMRGGNSSAEETYGGYGGVLTLATTMASYAPYNAGVTNSGAVDSTGGEGDQGGPGGAVLLWGQYKVDNTGDITTSGGTGRLFEGGYPGQINLRSTTLTSSGALTANGGSSTKGYGADARTMYSESPEDATVSIEAVACTVSGAISANGGNSAEAMGGNGGAVSVRSVGGASTVGTISVTPGTGATGTPVQGYVFVDGMTVSGPATEPVYPPIAVFR